MRVQTFGRVRRVDALTLMLLLLLIVQIVAAVANASSRIVVRVVERCRCQIGFRFGQIKMMRLKVIEFKRLRFAALGTVGFRLIAVVRLLLLTGLKYVLVRIAAIRYVTIGRMLLIEVHVRVVGRFAVGQKICANQMIRCRRRLKCLVVAALDGRRKLVRVGVGSDDAIVAKQLGLDAELFAKVDGLHAVFTTATAIRFG